MASDFDDIFGDLKEDTNVRPATATDDASHYGGSDPLGGKPSADKPAVGADDDFLSWLDDGAPSAAAAPPARTPTPPPPAPEPPASVAPTEKTRSGSHLPAASAPAPTRVDSYPPPAAAPEPPAQFDISLDDDEPAPPPAAAPEPPAQFDIDLDEPAATPPPPAPTQPAEVAPLPAPMSMHVNPPPAAPPAHAAPATQAFSLDDDDDDLDKIIENATKKPAPASGSRDSSHSALQARGHKPAQESAIDCPAARKTFLETGSITATSRLAVWKHAIQGGGAKEAVSMYAVQTTPLDLPSQALLRKDVESMCATVFRSATHAEAMKASGDGADSAELLFIDNAEILLTYTCKKLGFDYCAGMASTFAPLAAVSGSDPLRLEVIETLTAVCHRVLPHLRQQHGLRDIALVRRPFLKWLLLYHAPAMAFHLDQHFHHWIDDDGGVIPDTWLASMFETEHEPDVDALVRIWDCCLLIESATVDPSCMMVFIITHLIMRAEKKLLRMAGEQLRHCMGQTLADALKDKSDQFVPSVVKLVHNTPPDFSARLRDASNLPPPEPAAATAGADAAAAKPTSKGFSLIAASTNGVKELSSMMIDVPTKLLLRPLSMLSPTKDDAGNAAVAASQELFNQLLREDGGASITMKLPVSTVIPQVFHSFQAHVEGEKIRYFLVDCRASDEARQGQIPTAFHFDPDAVTDPKVLDQVQATLNPMKNSVHLCVMGYGYGHVARELKRELTKAEAAAATGSTATASSAVAASPFSLQENFFEAYAKDISRVNATVLYLTRQCFPYVSVLEGGYAEAHEHLYHSDKFELHDLLDHDSAQCLLCQHERTQAPPPAAVQSQPTRRDSSTNSQTSTGATDDGQKVRDLDARSLFDAHTQSNSYFSGLTGALKTSGKTLMSPADSLKDGTKWLMKKASDSKSGGASPGGSGGASSPSALPKFGKLRSSLSHLGAEGLDLLKKEADHAVSMKNQMKKAFGASSGSSKPSSSTPTAPTSHHGAAAGGAASAGHAERNASFQKSEEEVFTIDDDDEEEQDDFVGGGNARTASSSSFSGSARGDSFGSNSGDAPSLHEIQKGCIKDLRKGMRISRLQMLPCVESPFFSGYKKKKLPPATNGAPVRASMLPRFIVIAEGHIVVLKAERKVDDVYVVKSCHKFAHLARMTCLKKNALMVTLYYKWKNDGGDVVEKRNAYEVQQRDEFIKGIAMSDKKRESMASKIDEVARNQIWREQLKTEYIMESPLTPFQLNAKTLSAITQKPTLTHPADFAKGQEDKETLEIAAKMRDIMKRPNEKYPMPLTESQRVGWLHENALKGIRADMQQRMFKGRGSCDVIKFADTYCTMAGCSPFADKSTR
ncbi:TPA: hypothetical protein N0F65_001300 [Lagenidium giganteum]|uniref:TBC1 domain family member 23 n=1 Tax=Lagenidium giganteum TaxID=4803 RepID=A0AAV2Z200_9STRA|nr:TPA: hypothetical protein N0F65_001300 [Lagenidium giganteum]